MQFARIAFAALLLQCGCGRDGERDAALPVQAFATIGCRAPSLVAARPHPGGRFGFASWTPPASRPEALVAAAGVVHGEAPPGAGLLAKWSAAEVATWPRVTHDGTLRITSPALIPPIEGATDLQIVLRQGDLRQLEVVVSPLAELDGRLRAFRTLQLPLDAPEDPLQPTRIRADIGTVLTGNWGDESLPRRHLARLELALPAAHAGGAVVEEIRVEGPVARYAGVAAGRLLAERDEVVHPSWFVHGGASVRIPAAIPAAGAELRWYDAAVGTGTRRVLVHAGAAAREVAADAGARSGWVHRSASLAPWAGMQVEIELRSDAPGVGLFGAPRVVAAGAPAAPNVLLYMIDTLRADHLGAWGSPVPNVSPHLDRLAREGTQFGFAISSASWTKPAIPTLMTGIWDTTHRVGASTYADRLPASVPLLQDRFREAGWRTGSFSASPLGSTLSGLERGFDTAFLPGRWRDDLPDGLPHASADQLHDALLAWQAEEPDAPFFAYVHTMEAHSWREPAYAKPPEGQRRYDAAVADADRKLGALLASLEERGLLANTLIAVVSDHGESFGDHGVKNHGTSLYQSQIHVPLILWAGSALPSVAVADVVGLADVAPTLLDLFDLPPLPEADGVSLVRYLDGPAQPVHESVPSARVRFVWKPRDPGIYAMVGQDRHKLIRQAGAEQAFDLGADACEGHSDGRMPASLRAQLDAWIAAQAGAAARFAERHGGGDAAVDARDVEMLRALGYVE
jgi:hypothetical protein